MSKKILSYANQSAGLALAMSLALGSSYAPYASAFNFGDIGKTIGSAANTVGNTAENAGKEVVKGVNKAGEAVKGAAEDVINAGEKTANDTVDLVNKAGQKVKSCSGGIDKCAPEIVNTYYQGVGAVSTIATPVLRDAEEKVKQGFEEAKKLADKVRNEFDYFAKSETYVKQMKEPIEAMAKAWKELRDTNRTLFNQLTTAMINGNGPGMKAALENALDTFENSKSVQDSIQLWEDLDQGGSMMLFLSGSGGVLGRGELQIGIAVNMGYVVRSIKGLPLHPERDKAVLSLFSAAGLATGATAGFSADFNVGYHINPPPGVNGPSLDVGASVKAAVGGSWGAGFDLTKAPPFPVLAAVEGVVKVFYFTIADKL